MSTPAAPDKLDDLAAVRALAKLMESVVTIPGTNIRLGLDVLLGLLPGIGDVISTAVGGYIITTASKLGVSRAVLWRMMLNQGIDMAIGIVPFVGDLLDIGWKSNLKNAALLERALADPQATRRQSTGILVGLVLLLVLITAGTVALTWWLLRTIANAWA